MQVNAEAVSSVHSHGCSFIHISKLNNSVDSGTRNNRD